MSQAARTEMMLADLLLLPNDPADGSLEGFDTLLRVANTLGLHDTRPGPLMAAAMQAAVAAQAAEDKEEAAFEFARQLAAQVSVAQHAVDELQRLAQQMGVQGEAKQDESARLAGLVGPNRSKAAQYVDRQQRLEATLTARGVCPEVMQSRLHAAGREQGTAAAELAVVEQELAQFGGLPADVGAAAAATQTKWEELARLRQRLREHLDGIE
ncbi:hypothetical protein ACK3TF_003096 [Chlorella vulgaris]